MTDQQLQARVEMHGRYVEQAHRFYHCADPRHRHCCVIRGPIDSLNNLHIQMKGSYEASDHAARGLVKEYATDRVDEDFRARAA